MDGDDLTVRVLVAAGALDHKAIAQAGAVSRIQPAVTLARHLHEVLALDPQFATQRHGAFAEFRFERVVGRKAILALSLRIIVDDQFQGVEHGDATFGGFIHHFTHGFFKQRVFDQRIRFGYANAFGKEPETLRGITAPTRADQRRHARIVPSGHVLFFDELDQLALG